MVQHWGAGQVSYDWDETLSEWYVNDGRGLEHGFTVRQPPEGRAAVIYAGLKVWDANGRAVDAWDGSEAGRKKDSRLAPQRSA